MYVEKLSLLNIRSFPSTSLEFSKGINIIVGPNNSGKSTILRSLQKLQQGLTCFTNEDIRKSTFFGKIHIRLGDMNIDDSPLFQLKDRSVMVAKYQDVFFSFWNEDTYGKREDALQAEGGRLHVKVNDQDISATRFNGDDKNDSDFAPFSGFPSLENKNNFIFPFLAKRKTASYNNQLGVTNAFTITDQFSNLSARIQNLGNSTHPRHKSYIKLCEEILGFIPGNVPGTQTNEGRLGIYVNLELIYLESMGEGVANILGLLAILLTENNKLFLIEELENDIHPEALKKLLNIILEKATNNQFIISTHSNIVLKYLASLPDTKIFFCNWSQVESGNQNKYSIPTTKIEELANSPQERLRVLAKLGYDLFDFDLYSSYLIFEESSAEQIVREILIPMFVPRLLNRLKTISASGADSLPTRFDDFLRLFVYVHTTPVYREKAWVIADGDETGKANIAKLKDKFRSWPGDHFRNLSKVNFEEYYPEIFSRKFETIQSKFKLDRNKDDKRESKGKLTYEIIEWARTNREEAKNAFNISAKEVVDLLLEIELKLDTKKPF